MAKKKESFGLDKIPYHNLSEFIKTHYERLSLKEILNTLDFLSLPEDSLLCSDTIVGFIDYYIRLHDEKDLYEIVTE